MLPKKYPLHSTEEEKVSARRIRKNVKNAEARIDAAKLDVKEGITEPKDIDIDEESKKVAARGKIEEIAIKEKKEAITDIENARQIRIANVELEIRKSLEEQLKIKRLPEELLRKQEVSLRVNLLVWLSLAFTTFVGIGIAMILISNPITLPLVIIASFFGTMFAGFAITSLIKRRITRSTSKEIAASAERVPEVLPNLFPPLSASDMHQCVRDWLIGGNSKLISINSEPLDAIYREMKKPHKEVANQTDEDLLKKIWQERLFPRFSGDEKEKMTKHFAMFMHQGGYPNMLQTVLAGIAKNKGYESSSAYTGRKTLVFVDEQQRIHIKEIFAINAVMKTDSEALNSYGPLVNEERKGLKPLMTAMGEYVISFDENGVPKCSLEKVALSYDFKPLEDLNLFEEKEIREKIGILLDGAHEKTKEILAPSQPQPSKIQKTPKSQRDDGMSEVLKDWQNSSIFWIGKRPLDVIYGEKGVVKDKVDGKVSDDQLRNIWRDYLFRGLSSTEEDQITKHFEQFMHQNGYLHMLETAVKNKLSDFVLPEKDCDRKITFFVVEQKGRKEIHMKEELKFKKIVHRDDTESLEKKQEQKEKTVKLKASGECIFYFNKKGELKFSIEEPVLEFLQGHPKDLPGILSEQELRKEIEERLAQKVGKDFLVPSPPQTISTKQLSLK